MDRTPHDGRPMSAIWFGFLTAAGAGAFALVIWGVRKKYFPEATPIYQLVESEIDDD